jgi:hypothetical protein
MSSKPTPSTTITNNEIPLEPLTVVPDISFKAWSSPVNGQVVTRIVRGNMMEYSRSKEISPWEVRFSMVEIVVR